MREKLETLTLASLRELAKQNGVKSVTTMKKSELIDALLELHEKQQAEEAKAKAAPAKEKNEKKADNGSGDGEKSHGKKSVKKVIISNKNQGNAPENKSAAKPVQDNKTSENKPQEQNKSQDAQESYAKKETPADEADIANGIEADGILEVMQDGFGFIRCENYLPGENDVYVAPGMIRKYNLKTGDILKGIARQKKENESI